MNQSGAIENIQETYEVQVREHDEFISGLDLWIQKIQMKYDQVRPEDSISQVESAKTNRSYASSRSHRSSVVKLNEAKGKRELARFKLQQLERM